MEHTVTTLNRPEKVSVYTHEHFYIDFLGWGAPQERIWDGN
jgi:hypothetical protein